MLTRRLALLLAIPAVGLTACGSSDKDDIKQIITDGAKDPKTICGNLSKDVLKQIGGKDKCAEAAAKQPKNSPSKNLKVTINGSKATATFKDDDGDNTVKFIKESGKWKVSEVGNDS